MKLRFALRLLARMVIWPLLLVAVLYLILLLVNRQDRPANGDAQRLVAMYRARVPVADGDNAYLYLLGIGHLRQNDPDPTQRDVSPAFNQLSEGCRPGARACAALLEASGPQIRALLDDEAWLLARYRDLLGRRGWQMPLPIDTTATMPQYVNVATGQKLLMFDAWSRARAGDSAAVGAALSRDFAFWRMVLAETDDLLSKMVAVGALHRNLVWGNMVLAQLPPARQAAVAPAQWRTEFSIKERSLLKPVMGEYLYTMKTLGESGNGPARSNEATEWISWSLLAPLMQRQDSMNRWATVMVGRSAAMDVPYRDIPGAVARLRAQEQAAASGFTLDQLYNPLGRVLVAVGVGHWADYEVRGPDLEGVRRAALLALELRGAGVAPERAQDFVAAAALRNPYDGKPFVWDAASKSVTFTGLARGERKLSELIY